MKDGSDMDVDADADADGDPESDVEGGHDMLQIIQATTTYLCSIEEESAPSPTHSQYAD